jgi:hypothetical protein
VRVEDVENLWGVNGGGPVVEGQGDRSAGRARGVDDPERVALRGKHNGISGGRRLRSGWLGRLIRRGRFACGGYAVDIAASGVVDYEHETDHDTGDEYFPRWGHTHLAAVGEPGDPGSSSAGY